jgi:hypothetical protein
MGTRRIIVHLRILTIESDQYPFSRRSTLHQFIRVIDYIYRVIIYISGITGRSSDKQVYKGTLMPKTSSYHYRR